MSLKLPPDNFISKTSLKQEKKKKKKKEFLTKEKGEVLYDRCGNIYKSIEIKSLIP